MVFWSIKKEKKKKWENSFKSRTQPSTGEIKSASCDIISTLDRKGSNDAKCVWGRACGVSDVKSGQVKAMERIHGTRHSTTCSFTIFKNAFVRQKCVENFQVSKPCVCVVE